MAAGLIAVALQFAILGFKHYDGVHYVGGPIRVRAVIVLPSDVDAATVENDKALLLRHLIWSRDRYKELLHGATFRISDKALVVRLNVTAAQLTTSREGGAPLVVRQCLESDQLTRWNAPYVYLAIFEGTGDTPAGGGRPINGGHDLGGGIVILSASEMSRAPSFQTTLQHELGHAFGLPHVDAYGYDMTSNMSIMSYNPSHHTRGFAPSTTPGILIPEDIRGLAKNQWAFKGLVFDRKKDVPKGYNLMPDVSFGPMDLVSP